MKNPLIMTPGPTYVHEEVRRAMSKEITNPDLDLNFYELYKETCENLKKIFKTKNQVLILGGEGILGLEVACASLIEENDKVLCIDNGIFGKGFGDFAEIYGADVTYYRGNYRNSIDMELLKEFLKENHNFKMATVVHCETPAGITNPIDEICPLLKSYGILTVVDTVSAVAGEELKTDEWKIDIALGGSQKCLSSAPGLTILSLSDDALKAIESRKSPIKSFYCNLAVWKGWYENKWFPYTQPISDIYALAKAVKRVIAEEDSIIRHKTIARAVRKSLTNAGLSLYANSGHSNTVTTVLMPEGITFEDFNRKMIDDHNIMIAGAFDYLKDKVFRIGHMGENCREEKLYITLKAIDAVLKEMEFPLKAKIHEIFVSHMENE